MTRCPAHRPEGDYILVTTGGGGDGADLIHDVIDAYQQDPTPARTRRWSCSAPTCRPRKRRKLIKKGGKHPAMSRSSNSTTAWKS